MNKLKYFFLTVFFSAALNAVPGQLEDFKNQTNKSSDFVKNKSKKFFDFSKVKTKQTIKWAKEHKKSSAVIGVSLIGAVCLLSESKSLSAIVIHSSTTGIAVCLNCTEDLLKKIDTKNYNKYLQKTFENAHEVIAGADKLLNLLADLGEEI